MQMQAFTWIEIGVGSVGVGISIFKFLRSTSNNRKINAERRRRQDDEIYGIPGDEKFKMEPRPGIVERVGNLEIWVKRHVRNNHNHSEEN